MIFRIRAFELDDRLKELRCTGDMVRVQPKALELLLHLARYSDRLVSALELREVLWPNMAVSEGSLRQVLRQARRALADDAQQILRTVRGLGYRLTMSPVAQSGIYEVQTLRRGLGESDTQIFGRANEFARLSAAMLEAVAGSPRLCLVAGEAGIGKTRLLEELAAVARRNGAEVLLGRCAEEAGAPEYWPWVQILRHISELPAAREQNATGLPDLSVLLPELRTQVFAGASPFLTPEQAQFRLFDTVGQLLVDISRKQPLAVVFDDLHWADVSSLLLLRSITRGLHEGRLLFVGAYRDVKPDFCDPAAEIIDSLITYARGKRATRASWRSQRGRSSGDGRN